MQSLLLCRLQQQWLAGPDPAGRGAPAAAPGCTRPPRRAPCRPPRPLLPSACGRAREASVTAARERRRAPTGRRPTPACWRRAAPAARPSGAALTASAAGAAPGGPHRSSAASSAALRSACASARPASACAAASSASPRSSSASPRSAASAPAAPARPASASAASASGSAACRRQHHSGRWYGAPTAVWHGPRARPATPRRAPVPRAPRPRRGAEGRATPGALRSAKQAH